MPTFYVTKWALTDGIFEVIADEPDASYQNMISAHWKDHRGLMQHHFHGDGIEWHRKLESAVDRAKTMQANKISSLEKQVARVKALKF